jgi:ribonuclease PH
VVAQKLRQAEQMCRATGDADHWAATVALNDALTDYYVSDLRIYRAAMSVGITDEQWQAIKRGTDTDG